MEKAKKKTRKNNKLPANTHIDYICESIAYSMNGRKALSKYSVFIFGFHSQASDIWI